MLRDTIEVMRQAHRNVINLKLFVIFENRSPSTTKKQIYNLYTYVCESM